MLIRTFKSSFYAQYIILLIMAAALWSGRLYHSCEHTEAGGESPVYTLISDALQGNALLSLMLGFLLLLICAFLLNFVLIRHELLPRNSLLGALVFIILMSHPSSALGLNPVIAAAFFIILAFDRILGTYGKADPTQEVFSAAFLSALASIIYFPSVVLLLLLLISFVVFGTLSFRMLMVALSGVLAVYLYLFMVYFLNDQLELQYAQYVDWVSSAPPLVLAPAGPGYAIWAMLLMLFVAAMLHAFAHLNEWNISLRKKALLSLWFALLAGGTLFYEGDQLPIALLLVIIPLSMVIPAYLANRKKVSWLLEFYMIVLYLLTFANNLIFKAC